MRFRMCCEQLPSAAAPGAVREARGGLLQPRYRPACFMSKRAACSSTWTLSSTMLVTTGLAMTVPIKMLTLNVQLDGLDGQTRLRSSP